MFRWNTGSAPAQSRTARIACAALVLGLMLVATSVTRAEAETPECVLRVGWHPYAIYTFEMTDGTPDGADIALVRAVAKEIGCEVAFVRLPWARILLEIENGGLDVATSASRTTERDAYARFSVPYRVSMAAVFIRRGEARLYPLEDLGGISAIGLRLGVIAGYVYGERYQGLQSNPFFMSLIDGAADYATNIRKLVHRRIDGFLVDDAAVMSATARRLGVDHLVERHPLRMPEQTLHLMLSRVSVSAETARSIDTALDRMNADGSLTTLLDRYRAAGR